MRYTCRRVVEIHNAVKKKKKEKKMKEERRGGINNLTYNYNLTNFYTILI